MSVPAASVAGTFFFSRKAAKPRSFWEPRINTESHGFFYGKVFFCVFAFLRENFKLWVASHFASLTKRLPAKSLCVKGFFSREAAKPRSFWEPRINTELHGFFLRQSIFFCVFASLRENFKHWVVFHFALHIKRLPAKSLCVKGFFFRAKPLSREVFGNHG